MKYKNNRQYFAIKRQKETELRKMFPKLANRPGIYIFRRPSFYIGKATDILSRTASHALGKQQYIDHSIKKWGFTPIGVNGGGWQVSVLEYCSDEQLNEREQFWIDKYLKMGCKLYNIESGGADGKTDINQRQERKGYRQGKSDGMEKVYKQIAALVDKKWLHLFAPESGFYRKKPRKDVAELGSRIQKYLTDTTKCDIIYGNRVERQDAETFHDLIKDERGNRQ